MENKPMQPTIDDIKTIVSLQLGLKDVRADDDIVDKLGAESSDILNIILAIEEKFGVSIPDDDLSNIKTVTDLFDLAQSRA
jgi:acyl carrier protein